MKYIVDENKLWQLIGEAEYRDRKEILIDIKSKTPVEDIGTGEIGETKSSTLKSMEVVGIGIDTPNYVCIKNVELPKLTTKNIGKKVKIYIEVIK
jgi:hypothetical protein